MIRNKFIILLTLLLAVFLISTTLYSITFQEVVKIVKSATVKVISKKTGSFGSGFFINEEGQVFTCAHVLKSKSSKEYEKNFEVGFYKEEFDSTGKLISSYFITIPATVDTIVEKFDLAILNTDIRKAGFLSVTVLPIGNSDDAQEGDEIATCGFIPDGFSMSRPIVVKGIISVVRKDVFIRELNNTIDILQLDQQTAGGLSGAPLFALNLGVIGYMNASILPDTITKQSGFSFALAIDQVKSILEKYNYRKAGK